MVSSLLTTADWCAENGAGSKIRQSGEQQTNEPAEMHDRRSSVMTPELPLCDTSFAAAPGRAEGTITAEYVEPTADGATAILLARAVTHTVDVKPLAHPQ
jgi:hypothetical protein